MGMDIECMGKERQYELHTISSVGDKYKMEIMYPIEISKVNPLIRAICPQIEHIFVDKTPLLQLIEMRNTSEIGLVGTAYPNAHNKLIVIDMSRGFIRNIRQSNSKKEFSESMLVLIKIIVHELWLLNRNKGISELTSEQIKEVFKDYQELLAKGGENNGQ